MTAMTVDTSIPDSQLTREEIIARNLKAVEAHFHNENPESVEAAIALYADNVSWEGPARGIVMKDAKEILAAYRGIFRTVSIKSFTTLRRFATEEYVFDDQVGHAVVVGDEMPNLGFKKGDEVSVRLAHCFEMKDGKIVKEIAYEIFREKGGVRDVDDIPPGCTPVVF
ncbi:MAG: nuclear transport factor 2 family protein [Hyphomicrobiales bacterium]|nr:nuclear transport factor 2 family protein [Hyphomicrobiales bacterium]